jgi:hypothetical protein
VNALDLIAILLVIVGLILGARSGAIPQIGGWPEPSRAEPPRCCSCPRSPIRFPVST